MSQTAFQKLFHMINEGDMDAVFYEKGLSDEQYFKLQKLAGQILEIYEVKE